MPRARLALALFAPALFAQTAAFETASIKPSPPDARCGVIEPMPGGSLRICGLSLKTLVTWAYQVQDYQISGGPSWVENQGWEILAKPAESDATAGAPAESEKTNEAQQASGMRLVRERLRTLLTDRFHLVLRREAREQTAYALTVGKGGLKMKEAAAGMIKRKPGEIVSTGVTMQSLATFLAVDLRRPVADQTGLSARYEFTLAWSPDPTADASGPSVFTAIEEQLGLKLEARKAPVEALVIQSAERPEN